MVLLAMTPTELKMLKVILKNGGRVSLLRIANELKISPDYGHLICKGLARKKIVKTSSGLVEITDLGKRNLEELGMIGKAKQRRSLKRSGAKITKRAGFEAKAKAKKFGITALSDIRDGTLRALKRKGFRTLQDIATMNVSRLMEMIDGLKLKEAALLINKAREKLSKNGMGYLWGE